VWVSPDGLARREGALADYLGGIEQRTNLDCRTFMENTGATVHTLIPEDAPFNPEQRAWLNGYLAGLLSADRLILPALAGVPVGVPLLVLYGSQTGTSERLAHLCGRDAGKHGYQARVLGMERFKEVEWLKEARLLAITSTYGDGEMPDNAQAFWDFLQSDQAPNLSHLQYSILALGDTNYPQFCAAGKALDGRLEELGGKRVYPTMECDLDYEVKAKEWMVASLGALNRGRSNSALSNEPSALVRTAPLETASTSARAEPAQGRIAASRCLNGVGSAKETLHVEVDLSDGDLTYETGDALGIAPTNCPEFVQEILDAAGLDGEEPVKLTDSAEQPLRLALLRQFELKPYLADLPRLGTSVQELIQPLSKLRPRLYSIASSSKAHPKLAHLTVGIVRYKLQNRSRKGVCSTFLADRVKPGSIVPVFVHKAPNFRLPSDGTRPLIMVGPGTGIAPFRAFLQERNASGATGLNWLFFGDQHSATDFLYRDELLHWHNQGLLTRLDTAFSRDQEQKIYVQDRMIGHAGELWRWLESGGYFFVCGDAARMAKDVEAALRQVCQIGGNLNPETATEYVRQLRTEKRYCRDVY